MVVINFTAGVITKKGIKYTKLILQEFQKFEILTQEPVGNEHIADEDTNIDYTKEEREPVFLNNFILVPTFSI